MANNNNSSSGGVGLLGLVFLVFLILKLAEVGAVATWSWWAVTAPLWGGALLFCALMIGAMICAVHAQGLEKKRRLKRYMRS